MTQKTVFEIAGELAQAHVEDDPQTTAVYYVEGVHDEIRLVEVSGSLGNGGVGEVLPFRFKPQPEHGIPFASVLVLLSPSEWTQVQAGTLELPQGWDLDKLKKVV
ncbi:MAG: hypothetical protein Q8Q09_18810 [Deltaproteobacteria bacterium]|nr:hypothetical protein [Deltaproteobacteria bacterium]